MQGASESSCWTHQNNADLARVLSYQVADELVAGVGMVELGAGKVDAAKSAGTVQVGAIGIELDGQGRPDARPAWRVDLFDDDVDIAGRLFDADVAGGRRQAKD